MGNRGWFLGGCFGLLVGMVLWLADVWTPIELKTSDLLLRSRGVEVDDTNFAVVALDARTYDAWPEDRTQWGTHLAELLKAIQHAGAHQVAFDLVLAPNPRALNASHDPNSDLSEAILENPDTVILSYAIGEGGQPILPAEEFRLADPRLAYINLPASPDGITRNGYGLGGDRQSLAEVLSGRRVAGEFVGDMARWKIATISALDVGKRSADLKGRSVIIGVESPTDEDWRQLPVLGQRTGAEAQARLAATLAANTQLDPVSKYLSAMIIGVITAFCIWRRLIWGIVIAPIWILGAYIAMKMGHPLQVIGPVATLGLSWLGAIGGRVIDEKALRREIEQTFAYQVDEETMACLISNPGLRQPGEAMNVDAAILFLDVRQSTALGATMPNKDFFDHLNALFERILPIVKQHEGVVVDFSGDGFLALFGAFRPLDNDAQSAIDAARQMLAVCRPDDPRIGIGIHRGQFLLGSLGGSVRSQFSPIGNEVNLAARIQSATKEFNADLLVSAAVAERIEGLDRSEPLTFAPANYPGQVTIYRAL